MFEIFQKLFGRKEFYGLSREDVLGIVEKEKEKQKLDITEEQVKVNCFSISCLNVLLRNIEQQVYNNKLIADDVSAEEKFNMLCWPIDRIEDRIRTNLGERIITWNHTVVKGDRIVRFEEFIYWDWNIEPLFSVKGGKIYWDNRKTTLEGCVDAIIEMRNMYLPNYPCHKLRELLIAEQGAY